MWSNSENKVKMRTRSSSSTSSSPRSVLSKKSKKKSVTNEPQQSSKSKPLAKKARKHKLLSDLRRQLSKNDTRDDQKMSHDDDDDDDDDQLLINLFPLHPKRSLIKESDKNNHRMKDLQHEEDHNNTVVTYNFFDTTTDCGAASLTGLLWDSIEGVDKQCSTEQQEESLSPQSLTYSFQGEASDGLYGNSLLLRTALRQKEREIDSSTTEEKWVFYSEVVEKKEEEDMSTCTLDSGNHYYNTSTQISPRLSLKLDYEVIMNAWSDRGSLYIGGDCSSSQIVPDILDDPLTPDSTNNVTYGDAAGCMLWKVPEHHLRHDGAQSIREDHSKMMEEREARVLRYKEKRQNRLFSKRIRYEVRKLNAEKRPRMKGRFVRRS